MLMPQEKCKPRPSQVVLGALHTSFNPAYVYPELAHFMRPSPSPDGSDGSNEEGGPFYRSFWRSTSSTLSTECHRRLMPY
jgi:hypothetical protein